MMKHKLISVLAVATVFMSVTITAMANPFADDVFIVNIQEVPYAEETVNVNINHPIPDAMLNTPAINVSGYEMEEGDAANKNPFTGDFDLELVGDKSIAYYKNGSVAILHSDGTFEGRGYDGSTVTANPKTGELNKQMDDGTTISYTCGQDYVVEKPNGDKVTVDNEGKTTVERANGLISEHNSNGKTTGLGLTGNNLRIDPNVGGSIDGANGTHLEITDGNSISFTDNKSNSFHIADSDGHMNTEIHGSNGFAIKADPEALTITSPNGNDYEYEFDRNGIATLPLDAGGDLKYHRDDYGFSYDSDGFVCNFDADGNLTDFDDGEVSFSLRVNPDGSIISGKFMKDENWELIEVKGDGSGTYEKDGGKLTFNLEDGLDVEDFDWFDDFAGLDTDEPDDTQSDFDPADEQRWDNMQFSGEIEPLNIQLKLYSISAGSLFNIEDGEEGFMSYHMPDPPQNISVRIDKDGHTDIFLPAFEYTSPKVRSDNDHMYDTWDYQRGSHAQMSLKGSVTETYTIQNPDGVVYVQAGRITERSHYIGEWEKYDYFWDDLGKENPEHIVYLDQAQNYQLEIYPYDGDEYESQFWVYYFTNNDTYQVELSLDGRETGYDFTGGYDLDNFALDHSKDIYDNFADEYGGIWVRLFEGDSADDWQHEKTSDSSVISNRKYYGVSD